MLINALIVQSEDSSLFLSLNNSRLINYRQQSSLGYSSYILGKVQKSQHPLTHPLFTTQLKSFLSNPLFSSQPGYLQASNVENFELVSRI